MKLTRQHFKFIANILRKNKPKNTNNINQNITWDNIVLDFASELRKANFAFNTLIFYQECGIDQTKTINNT